MLAFLKEFTKFIIKRKNYLLMPIFLVMLILGSIVTFTEGSIVTPLIYTLF